MTRIKKTESEPSRPGYIPPVGVAQLQQAAAEGHADPGWEQIKPSELVYVGRWRAYRQRVDYTGEEPEQLAGLSLSGGGIRSATFSLGIMQALAARGVLKRMDYISTVSGGGFIGSAVSWLVSEQARRPLTDCDGETGQVPSETELSMEGDHFPFGTDDPAPDATTSDNPTQRGLLRYLREHGYYLTPGNGITAVSLLATVLRGTLLNLLVWIPAFVLFFVFGLMAFQQAANQFPAGSGLGGDSAHPGAPPAFMILPRLLSVLEPRDDCGTAESSSAAMAPPSEDCVGAEQRAVFAELRGRLPQLLGFELFLDISVLITLGLVLGTLGYSLLTWARRGRTNTKFCFWYDARRRAERLVAILIPVALATFIIGTLPVVAAYLHGWMASAGPLAMLSGIVLTLRQFFTAGLSSDGKLNGFLVSLGAGLFLYGVFLVAYQIAFLGYPTYLQPGWAWVALVVWVGVFGWFVNLDYISVHRFYRDRLMESFMPDIPRALRNETGKAVGADAATLQQVGNPDDPRGPSLIVNTNVILVDSEEPVYRQRGGDNFILTPCTAAATPPAGGEPSSSWGAR
ncbi:MAG: patatin-like phospholipase family protein [Pseudomonadota bacterium]|nr:patatin-like phospholipase family protein [Pseudomonadota bacterium]